MRYGVGMNTKGFLSSGLKAVETLHLLVEYKFPRKTPLGNSQWESSPKLGDRV